MAESLQANSTVEISFEDQETAEIVRESLEPEELLPKSARAEVEVGSRENILCLDIKARDTVALRAAINSFLRWATVARDMTEV